MKRKIFLVTAFSILIGSSWALSQSKPFKTLSFEAKTAESFQAGESTSVDCFVSIHQEKRLDDLGMEKDVLAIQIESDDGDLRYGMELSPKNLPLQAGKDLQEEDDVFVTYDLKTNLLYQNTRKSTERGSFDVEIRLTLDQYLQHLLEASVEVFDLLQPINGAGPEEWPRAKKPRTRLKCIF